MAGLTKGIAAALLLAGAGAGGYALLAPDRAAEQPAATGTIPLTIATSGGGSHRFQVEVARTAADQQLGLMFRTDIPKDGGMLFAPYPPEGGPPRAASFWMRNTPSPLDILFIRADGTIATLAENTVPYSETPIPSGEPVAAVLELNGGRAAELGIAEGDRVSWAK